MENTLHPHFSQNSKQLGSFKMRLHLDKLKVSYWLKDSHANFLLVESFMKMFYVDVMIFIVSVS